MAHVYRAQTDLPIPIDEAWRILTTFRDYPTWNLFTPRVSGRLAPGEWVTMRVDLGWITLTQRERICELAPPHRLAWELPGPRWLLYACREQTLSPTSTGCTYTTVDTIEGLLAPVVERLFGDALRTGFGAVADGLSAHVAKRETSSDRPTASPS